MRKIIIYVFLFFSVILIFCFINFINNYFGERVETYIENKGIIYTQSFIQEAITEYVTNDIDIDKMYIIQKDENNNVKSVVINTNQINYILSLVNQTLEKELKSLNEEKLKIPFGIILGETIFSNIGPNINLTIIPIGNYKCDIVTEISEYGINNSLFEIFINIKMKIEALVPLNKVDTEVICNIPIVIHILQGDVPRYYYNTDKLIPDVYDNIE